MSMGMGNMGSMNMGKGNMGSMRKDQQHGHKGKEKGHMGMMQDFKQAARMMGMGMGMMGMGMGMGTTPHIPDKNPAKYTRSLGHNIVTSLVTQTTTALTVLTGQHNDSDTDFIAIVSFLYFGTTGTITCADSLGNSYNPVATVTFNTDYTVKVFYVSGIHSIAKNAIITITHPASTRRILMADEFKNVEKTNTADQVATGHNTIAATFATSGMLPMTVQDKELLYGVIAVNGSSIDTFKKPTNWTLLHDRGTNAGDGNDIRLITQFRNVNSTGTFEVSGTLGTASLWAGITQSFKAEGGASAVTPD